MTISTKTNHLLGYAGLSLLVGVAGVVQGAGMDLAQTPLFLGDSVDPNVYFELDDSGSMDWEILTKKHWHYCAYDSNALAASGDDDCGWLVDNGLFRVFASTGGGGSFQYFEYMFETGDHAYWTACESGRQVIELCTTATSEADWRVFSSDLNVMYFDPSSNYRPWVGFSDADFSAVRSDPQPGSDGYGITRDLGSGDGFTFHVWNDDRGWSGARPRRGDNINATDTPNGMVDLWDSHTEFNVTGDSVRYRTITYAPDADGLNPTVSEWTEITDASPHPEYGTPDEIRGNVANWYQYYRRRAYVAKAAVGAVVDNNPNFRYGMGLINDGQLTAFPSADLTDYSTHNSDMMDTLYSYDWRAQGTPLRRGLEDVGEYYRESGVNAPITHECQQNFTVLFTDGYWNGGDPASVIGDSDGDGYDRTLADVADYYYRLDLRSDLADDVATNQYDDATHQHMVTYTVAFGVEGWLLDEDGDGWPDHRDDGSAFVVVDDEGNLLDSGRSADWGNPFNWDSPEKIDDMWHAAFNSRGEFLAASTPQALMDSLESTLQSISDRTGSAASVALNSGSLNSNTHLYQARFDAENWSGQLLAYAISSTGLISTSPVWDARDELEGKSPDDRVILSYGLNSASELSGLPFRYTSVGDKFDAALSEAEKEALVNYLRGDRSNEGTGFDFRSRTYLLGDVIHSNPVYVGDPAFRYPDEWIDLLYGSSAPTPPENGTDATKYSAFVDSYSGDDGRIPVIYFGANDGMLHGVNAETGEEVLAYVPGIVYDRLPELSSKSYTHKYFVDGPPTVVDAFFDNAWHTVLVGGLGGGGKGIFALDVTDPASFSEDNAENVVLWEFSSENDEDMGYSYSQPAVVRLHSGDWGVILANGYDSINGKAVLYILDIRTGAIMKKIDTDPGGDMQASYDVEPNGLSTPAPVDRDGDGIIDFVYAGDLYGNLWKFDLTGTSASDWDVAQFDGAKQALFTAISVEGERQPITVLPDVGFAPYGQAGSMVYFGTGKYLENDDNTPTGQITQSFYGIWDRDIVVSRSDLQEQEILLEKTESFTNADSEGNVISTSEFDVRVLSDTDVAWRLPPNTSGSLGWYIDLVVKDSDNNQGERVVANPVLRNDRVLFATLIPSAERCAYGGSSWLMEVDAYTGGSLPYAAFDLNQDGVFDAEDYVEMPEDADGTVPAPVTASGKKSKVGIIPTPGILSGGGSSDAGGAAGTVGGTDADGSPTDVNACAPGAECALTSGSSGDIEATRLNPGKGEFGRQSWQELR